MLEMFGLAKDTSVFAEKGHVVRWYILLNPPIF